jgi:hypothetical protein
MSGWLNNKGKEAKEKRLGLPPSLTDAKPSRTQRVQDVLSKVTEAGGKLTDWMYFSPEESFDRMFPPGSGSSMRYGNMHNPEKDTPKKFVSTEGLKSLWEQAGKPYMMQTSGDAGFFKPKGAYWDMGFKSPKNLVNKIFGSDQVNLPPSRFLPMPNAELAVEELAHSMRFKDPKRYSRFDSRKELARSKGSEHVDGFDESLYGKEDTDEYQTHSVVAPKLKKWLLDNYGEK